MWSPVGRAGGASSAGAVPKCATVSIPGAVRRGRRRCALVVLGAIALVLSVSLAATGLGVGQGGSRPVARPPLPPAPAASPAVSTAPQRPLLGLDENNADLLFTPLARAVPAALEPWRRQLLALHPRVLRFVIDWARLAPAPDRTLTWNEPEDGCLRGLSPCGAYGGVRDRLLAVASQRRAGVAVEPLVVIDDTPAWAARSPGGCETAGATASARPLNARGLSAYRQLIASLLSEARRDGVDLPYLSPWNEPDNPRFITPQHASCSGKAASLAVVVYTQLARAMAGVLAADGSAHRLLLGDLAAYPSSSARRTGLAQFVGELPRDVLCLSSTWALHVYISPAAAARAALAPVDALLGALRARGGCGASERVWITETGTGALHPGSPRLGSPTEELSGCRAMAQALSLWRSDPAVDVVLQYTFRDDTLFPVGLADAGLTRLYPTYGLLRAFSAGTPDVALAGACGHPG